MSIFTINWPKYGPRMALIQIGPIKNDFQGYKTIQNASPWKG